MFGFLFRYQVSIIAFVHFLAMCFLGIANGAYSIVTTCQQYNDCLSNALVSVVYWLLIAAWFGFLWILAYAAQEKRNKRLAQLLIACELLVAFIAYYNAKHHPDPIGLITSIVDIVFALWVALLAFRLMRAKGGRVVAKQRGARARTRRRS